MGVRGNAKQEKKIEAMTAIVQELHPQLNALSAKGVFRKAIAATLEEWKLQDWKELADRPAATRESFFSTMSSNAASHLLKIGFPPDKTRQLEQRLLQFNKGFVRQ